MNELNQQLSLVVLNSEQLEGNSQVQYQFHQGGGTLGSSEQDSWKLKDRLGAVLPEHARIEIQDGRFCLCDLSGQTFINGATSPIGRSRKVFLDQGDELTVGPFRLRVYLGKVSAEPELAQIIGNRSENELDDWLAQEKATENTAEQTSSPSPASDPLLALQQEQTGANAFLTQETRGTPEFSPTTRVSSTSSSAAEGTMDQEFLELPAIQDRFDSLTGGDNIDQNALAPLMRGLGQTLNIGNNQHLSNFLEEMGKTLRAMIEGLLKLQADQAALSDKHLRPIEDNPLRLSLDYHDTLALLFAEEKSPVHLSAPAAVDEVLRNVRIHHVANQQAIATALDSILQAFSPDVLLKRFEHYRRSGEQNPMDDGWAWSMYQHYFRELTSERQQGFQKLFQQVYSQAYDRVVREQQELI